MAKGFLDGKDEKVFARVDSTSYSTRLKAL
jgi:hypothetical protein